MRTGDGSPLATCVRLALWGGQLSLSEKYSKGVSDVLKGAAFAARYFGFLKIFFLSNL